MQNSKVSAIDGISGRDSQAGIQPDSLPGAFKDIPITSSPVCKITPVRRTMRPAGNTFIDTDKFESSSLLASRHVLARLLSSLSPRFIANRTPVPLERKWGARATGHSFRLVSAFLRTSLNARHSRLPCPLGIFHLPPGSGRQILRSRCMQTGDASAASCPARAKRSPTASMKRFDSRLIAAPAFASPSTSTVPRVLLPATFEMLASSAASFPLLTCFRRKIASGGFACFETVLIFPAISPISSRWRTSVTAARFPRFHELVDLVPSDGGPWPPWRQSGQAPCPACPSCARP